MRFFLLFLLFTNSAVAQNLTSDTTATFITYWAEGDTQTYSVTITSKNFENKVLIKEHKSSHTVEFTVLEETETGYLIEAYFKDFVTDSDLFQNGLKAVYSTDELGAYTELVNFKEMQDSMNVAYDRLVASSNSSDQKKLINKLRKTATSRASIEFVLFEDLQVFHNPFGLEFTLGQKDEYEAEIPNIFGGENFPTIMFMELTELDPSTDHCQLVIDQEIDQEKCAEMLAELLKQLAIKVKTDNGIEREDLGELSIDDVYTFDMLLETGWMEYVNYTRTFLLAETEQIKIFEMKLIE